MGKLKDNKVMIVKVAGMLLTVGGMVASSWSGKKDQDATLKKLVKEELQNKMGES